MLVKTQTQPKAKKKMIKSFIVIFHAMSGQPVVSGELNTLPVCDGSTIPCVMDADRKHESWADCHAEKDFNKSLEQSLRRVYGNVRIETVCWKNSDG